MLFIMNLISDLWKLSRIKIRIYNYCNLKGAKAIEKLLLSCLFGVLGDCREVGVPGGLWGDWLLLG